MLSAGPSIVKKRTGKQKIKRISLFFELINSTYDTNIKLKIRIIKSILNIQQIRYKSKIFLSFKITNSKIIINTSR